MAKNKNLNPAEAFRKAQRKKELKKNKTERAKTRDFALVKKDTRELEEDIEKLESVAAPSAADKTRLAELKTELEKITKKKEDYVAEHPEHRKLVFKGRKPQGDREDKEETAVLKTRKLFRKDGLPRHPERSIYYDPVMNPYGVAPPGMPYMERPLRPDEVASDENESEGDEDIVMPEGPPPGRVDDEDDSDDDIPMPEGPPPPQPGDIPPLPAFPHPAYVSPTACPTGPNPPPPPPGFPVGLPPPPIGLPPMPPHPSPYSGALPPLPPGFPVPPPRPSGFPVSKLPPPPPGFSSIPPLPPGFPNVPPPSGISSMSPPFPPPSQNQLPPPPPGFYPRRSQSASAMQDPLSSVPHLTYQAHRASMLATPAHPSLPPNPTLVSASAKSSSISMAATISAAPELRDLKKESTAFVPSALKRKRAGASGGPAAKRVDAAPSLEPQADSAEPNVAPAARPDLLSTLKGQFGSAPAPAQKPSASAGKAKPKDDYEKFVEEMGDILGPSA